MYDIHPGNIIFLLTRNHYVQPDETGFNEVGVALDKVTILVRRKSKLIRIRLDKDGDIEKIRVNKFGDNDISLLIAEYFQKCEKNKRLFSAGMSAIVRRNYKFFTNGYIFPEKKKYENIDHYENCWEKFESLLEVGDSIFTVNQGSIFSRIISGIDHGKWSHVATYIGNGLIGEALVKEGVCIRNLSNYKDRRFEVGAYRLYNKLTEKNKNDIVGFMVRNAIKGTSYNFKGAILCGIKTFLGRDPDPPTPNGLLYKGIFYLVSSM